MPRVQRNQPKAPLQDRLIPEAMRLKEEANELPPGPLRDARIRKAHQASRSRPRRFRIARATRARACLGPRFGPHADAVGWRRECRLHHGEAVAAAQ
jgi:hypothetical protein